ncbi:MAG: DUF1648 domain-containing protein [Halodesulfurarchaeum sp.]|nr:DUF1648 domain-containing protein [Halodesulfurarchaeum sp.]
MVPNRQIDAVAVGLAAIPLLAAFLVWADLPPEMAIHWGPGGPDTFVAKPLATVGLFAFGIATIAFVRLAPNSLTSTPGGTNPTVLFLGFVFAWVEGMVVVWNLGVHFPVELAVVPILVFAGVLVAYSYWWQ